MAEFLAKRIVAIGWPGTGSLEGLDREGILRILKDLYPRDGGRWGPWSLTMLRFRDTVRAEDLILVAPRITDSLNIAIARIAGAYKYDPACVLDGYSHQKPVRWLATQIPRQKLPAGIRRALRAQQPLIELKGPALWEFCENLELL